jgi:hypothetical protein
MYRKSATEFHTITIPSISSSESFFGIRLALLRSFAVLSVVQELFSGAYPRLSEVFISPLTGDCPLDCANLKIQRSAESSHFRLSPNIVDCFGHGWRGAFTLAIAATAHALVENADTTAAFLEIAIGDCTTAREFSDLLIERENLAMTITRMAPPFQPGATAEESAEWMNEIVELIETATNTDLHPFECVPWF